MRHRVVVVRSFVARVGVVVSVPEPLAADISTAALAATDCDHPSPLCGCSGGCSERNGQSSSLKQ